MKVSLGNTIIDKVTTMKDHSVKITLVTRELSPEEMVQLFSHINQEVPEIEFDTDVDQKTPAKRLRDRLYVYYKEARGSDQNFRRWYEEVLDVFGRKYLDKISKDGEMEEN